MSSIAFIDRVQDLASLSGGPVEPLQVEAFQLTRPSGHLVLQSPSGELLARCSLWRARDARGQPTADGLIGHYAALDSRDGRELLRHASSWHRSAGRERVIGPMDGSTWHRYRLLTERGTEPAFFLEPDNPDDWPQHFTDAGFLPLATYISALNSDLGQSDPRSDRRRTEFEGKGITIRRIDLDRFDLELAAIHELSLEAFAHNFLYSPIDLETFVASYAPIRPHLVPDVVLVAELDGKLVGFLYAIPDLMEPTRGQPQRTVILKSLAVHPAYAGKGLGGLLVDDCQQAARKLGFERAMHPLMHETNRSRSISARYGTIIRRYTLYARPLSDGEH